MGAQGNVISGNNANGVHVINSSATNVVLAGNLIGTNAAGSGAIGNGGNGVFVEAVPGVIIGSAFGNLISGTGGNGVLILGAGASGNQVLGNFIGLDAAGSAALPNTLDGVRVDAAPNNVIGGTAAGSGNVISGNDGGGVLIANAGATGNQVQRNRIGTNMAGTAALPNVSAGITIDAPGGNTIGGTTAAARNVISGNNNLGIVIQNGASNNSVQGNHIGTNDAGSAALPNLLSGIAILNAPNNTIGGTAAGAGNLISGNTTQGVAIGGAGATGNQVQGNLIGTNAGGGAALANGQSGVEVSGGAANNAIGGTAAGAANTIAFNGAAGVFVHDGGTIRNAILSNSIHSNGGLGIVLQGGGNNNQPAPALSSAVTNGSGTMVQGSLTAAANTTYTIQFFSNTAPDPSGAGEGQTFAGSTSVTTNGSGTATFSATIAEVPAGQFLSATATDPLGNTSQFAQNVVVQAVPTATPTSTATATSTNTPSPTSTPTNTPTSTSTSTPTTTATASVTATPPPGASATPTPRATVAATATRTATSLPTGTGTPSLSPTPSRTPTRTSTPTGTAVPAISTPTATATVGIGQSFHVFYPGGGTPQLVVLPGPCPDAAPNCLTLTIVGSFTVRGTLSGVAPGSLVTVTIPVVDASGARGTRTVSCGPASAAGIVTCNATVVGPVFPAAGAVVPPLVVAAGAGAGGGAAAAPAPAAAGARVVIPLLPPLLVPPAPPPVLPPPLPPLAPLSAMGPAEPSATPYGVPVAPEADSLLLLALGLLGLGVIAGASRRAR